MLGLILRDYSLEPLALFPFSFGAGSWGGSLSFIIIPLLRHLIIFPYECLSMGPPMTLAGHVFFGQSGPLVLLSQSHPSPFPFPTRQSSCGVNLPESHPQTWFFSRGCLPLATSSWKREGSVSPAWEPYTCSNAASSSSCALGWH